MQTGATKSNKPSSDGTSDKKAITDQAVTFSPEDRKPAAKIASPIVPRFPWPRGYYPSGPHNKVYALTANRTTLRTLQSGCPKATTVNMWGSVLKIQHFKTQADGEQFMLGLRFNHSTTRDNYNHFEDWVLKSNRKLARKREQQEAEQQETRQREVESESSESSVSRGGLDDWEVDLSPDTLERQCAKRKADASPSSDHVAKRVPGEVREETIPLLNFPDDIGDPTINVDPSDVGSMERSLVKMVHLADVRVCGPSNRRLDSDNFLRLVEANHDLAKMTIPKQPPWRNYEWLPIHFLLNDLAPIPHIEYVYRTNPRAIGVNFATMTLLDSLATITDDSDAGCPNEHILYIVQKIPQILNHDMTSELLRQVLHFPDVSLGIVQMILSYRPGVLATNYEEHPDDPILHLCAETNVSYEITRFLIARHADHDNYGGNLLQHMKALSMFSQTEPKDDNHLKNLCLCWSTQEEFSLNSKRPLPEFCRILSFFYTEVEPFFREIEIYDLEPGVHRGELYNWLSEMKRRRKGCGYPTPFEKVAIYFKQRTVPNIDEDSFSDAWFISSMVEQQFAVELFFERVTVTDKQLHWLTKSEYSDTNERQSTMKYCKKISIVGLHTTHLGLTTLSKYVGSFESFEEVEFSISHSCDLYETDQSTTVDPLVQTGLISHLEWHGVFLHPDYIIKLLWSIEGSSVKRLHCMLVGDNTVREYCGVVQHLRDQCAIKNPQTKLQQQRNEIQNIIDLNSCGRSDWTKEYDETEDYLHRLLLIHYWQGLTTNTFNLLYHFLTRDNFVEHLTNTARESRERVFPRVSKAKARK